MQNGSVIRAERRRGPDVWEFRWREPGADGKRKHCRIVLGSVEELADEAAARQAIAPLRLHLAAGDTWLKARSTTVFQLVSHYRKRELEPDTIWKTHSTKVSYDFNHGIRHEICDRNPIHLVWQSAKGKTIPVILTASEVQRLISVLKTRERTLVLLAFGTG